MKIRLSAPTFVIAVLFVTGWCGRDALAQQSANSKAIGDAPQGPDYVPYQILFRRIGDMDARAYKLDAQDKSAAAISERTGMQQAIGLHDQAWLLLRHVAADNNTDLKKNDEKIKAARAAHPGPDSPEVKDLLDDEEEIVRDHMGQLQTGLGDEACLKIQAYVKRFAKAPKQSKLQIAP